MSVLIEKNGNICTIILNRPEVRNAIDGKTAKELADAFRTFDKDDTLDVAVLWGKGGCFCAGADLKAVSQGPFNAFEHNPDMKQDGPLDVSRMFLSKPVIAAVSGYAVAGGLELALWCDMRVAERDAVFGVFCRRFGVPLIDGGTQRLPRLIGISRAMDMILTGRSVGAEEALTFGLVNRVVEVGKGRQEAEGLASEIALFPQRCLRSDRKAVLGGFDLPFEAGMKIEFDLGLQVLESGETAQGASRFVAGTGRHGKF